MNKQIETVLKQMEPEYRSHVETLHSYIVTLQRGKVLISKDLVRRRSEFPKDWSLLK